MTKNVGNLDRAIRFILGAILLSLPFIGIVGGWTTIAAIIGAVLLVTSVFSFCPLYRVLGMSS